jgi:hypothetical protein
MSLEKGGEILEMQICAMLHADLMQMPSMGGKWESHVNHSLHRWRNVKQTK